MLEDGTPVDPAEVSPDKTGALVHKSGKVAIGDHGNYRTTGIDLDDKGKPLFGGKGDHDRNGTSGGTAAPTKEDPPAKADDANKTEDMNPEPASAPKAKKPYKTR